MKKNRSRRHGRKNKGRHDKASWNRGVLSLGLVLMAGAIVLVLAKRENAVPRGADVERSPMRTSPTSAPASNERIPPYHEDANEAKPFPETLSPSLFENAVVARAYQVSGEIPGVLVQQPCYCFCEGHGHESLLDCYTDYHGAG